MATTPANTAKTAAKSSSAVREAPPALSIHQLINPNPADFRAVATYEKTVHDHRTGRRCPLCGGDLHDSIVNFGEPLPALPFSRAMELAETTDLCLVLGSSCTVTPAAQIPEIVGARRRGAKLAICNLQKTPLDRVAAVRVHAETDKLMGLIMEELGLPVPGFVLRRRLRVRFSSQGGSRHEINVCGVDVDETPVTFLQSVKLENNRRLVRSEPFNIQYRGDIDPGTDFRLQLEFMGNYGEPNLDLVHVYNGEGDAHALYLLNYDPQTGMWEKSREESIGSS